MEIKEALEIRNKYKKEWNELEDFGDLRYPPSEGLESLLETAKETIKEATNEIQRLEEAITSGVVIHTDLAKKQLAEFKKVLNDE